MHVALSEDTSDARPVQVATVTMPSTHRRTFNYILSCAFSIRCQGIRTHVRAICSPVSMSHVVRRTAAGNPPYYPFSSCKRCTLTLGGLRVGVRGQLEADRLQDHRLLILPKGGFLLCSPSLLLMRTRPRNRTQSKLRNATSVNARSSAGHHVRPLESDGTDSTVDVGIPGRPPKSAQHADSFFQSPIHVKPHDVHNCAPIPAWRSV